MVEGKKGDKKEKEKRSQKKKDSGKSLIKKNFDIDDLRSNKKLLKAVHDQLKGYQLIYDSSQTSSFSSEESDSEKRKTRSKKHKHKLKSSDTISESSLSDSKDSSSESDSFTRSIKEKYRKNKRKSGLVVSSKHKTKYQQDCPQSKLQLEYANKKIKFEDLKFHQFVAGEMEIIVSCKNDKEKNGRLTLLKKISYYYELYDWKALLQFYAAWIRRVESDCTCTLPALLTGSWWDSRTNAIVSITGSLKQVTTGWEFSVNTQQFTSFTCIKSDASRFVFRSDLILKVQFGLDYYAVYCLEYTYLTDNSYSYYIQSDIEGLTGNRVLLVDVNTEAAYSGISDYCNPTNGPDTGEYNVLVKQSMQNAVHQAQYFPDPLLGVFNYTIEDSAGTYCEYNSNWDGCYVNGVIDRTSITLNYIQCSKNFMGSSTGVLYNVANVTLSGSTYYVIMINSEGTDTIFTCVAISQNGNNRYFSTNPGGCAKDQKSTARTSHADSTNGTMIATVFTTTTSTTTESPTTTVNSTGAITNASENSSSGSNTGAIVGAVLSILLLIAIIIIAYLIYQKYFKKRTPQNQHRKPIKDHAVDIKQPLPEESDFSLSEPKKSKGQYPESSMVVDNLSPRDNMKDAFLEDTEPLPQKSIAPVSSTWYRSPSTINSTVHPAPTSTVHPAPLHLNDALRRNLTPLPEQPRPPTSSALRTRPLPSIGGQENLN
ncbi:unnamed protein product [Mytilus coruscus]|uniref:Uncharacterized protein n=1 Tax=Mytilus coruscus TaxID=42192 RepID=A0A6J8ALC4_MYTCO|nr:unnamed protein product [Mytilus coruscus]